MRQLEYACSYICSAPEVYIFYRCHILQVDDEESGPQEAVGEALASGAPDSGDDLGQLTAVELKERCRSRGLKVGGTKAALLQRLRE